MVAMARLAAVTVLVVILCLVSSVQSTDRRRGRELVAEYHTQFGLDMYTLIAQQDQSSNIFFSPISIGSALAMAYAGSNGNTSLQIHDVLHFEGQKKIVLRGHRGLLRWSRRRYKKGVTVKMTNRLYAAHNLRLRSKFSTRMERIFGAKVNRLDFAQSRRAAAKINEMVKKDTAGNIEELMEPGTLDAMTRLVMVNAIYFKGDWLMKFNRSATAPADFHTLTGTKQVQMIKAKKGFPVGEAYDLGARVLKLPYKGEDISMMILLPNSRDGIHQLDAKMESVDFERLSWSMHSDDDVEVQLPRFKMEERINLKAVLQQMGLTDLFDKNVANLRGISGREQLYVSEAMHKAAIEVTEEGTEASAATAFAFSSRMLRPKPEPFIVDRPFIFAIRDEKVGATLFLGRVMEP